MNKKKSFLGTGWGFPPSFNKDLASVEMVSDEQDIKESLHIYLSTKIVVMSPRPGRIIDIIQSDLPDNRPLEIRDTKEFIDIAQRVREGLRSGHTYE